MPTPQQVEALQSLLDTRAPVTLVETHDELRVLALFTDACKRNGRELWTWSAASGLRVVQGLKLQLMDMVKSKDESPADTKELPAAIAAVEKMKEPALVLFLDIQPYLSNPVITRGMKELALRCEARGLQLVFVGHDIELPEELSPLVARFDLEPMTLERVKALFNEELKRRRAAGGDTTGSRGTLDSLLRHLVGLPEASVRHLARRVLGDGEVDTADLARVLEVKRELMGGAEVLHFEHRLPTLDEVAGMAALKRWLQVRRDPFLAPEASGLPPPRGVLLLGVQGAGKSLAAKAIAASWQVPLFRMDFGALYDKWQGESERKLREALRVADAMQPCVLWMDEIEKGLAGSGGGADDGTGAGRRMLGTLLTWMAERRASVFLAATANDVESLPPELMRKGRFDEIFFVDLPGEAVRAGIFSIHLGKHRIAFDDAALARLVAASAGFSGAEIEAAIVAARYEAHGSTRAPAADQVAAELARTRPLSVTRAEAIAALRDWAADRTVGAD